MIPAPVAAMKLVRFYEERGVSREEARRAIWEQLGQETQQRMRLTNEAFLKSLNLVGDALDRVYGPHPKVPRKRRSRR